MENEKITLQELANYAAAASFQAYCQGSVAPAGDLDPTTEKWERKRDAAAVIIRDFFFDGDEDAANKYIIKHGESKQFHTFIGDIDRLRPELYDQISENNRDEMRREAR